MGRIRRRAAIALVTAGLAAATASSDEILLRSGGRVSGVIVERTRTAIVVETGPGRVTLSMSLVEKVVEGRSALEAYRERAEALEPGDVEGWAALARWAAERDLLTQSREAWQRVLAADPSHPEANAALGRVEVDGTWMGRGRRPTALAATSRSRGAGSRRPSTRPWCASVRPRKPRSARPARPGCGCGRPRRAPVRRRRGPGRPNPRRSRSTAASL